MTYIKNIFSRDNYVAIALTGTLLLVNASLFSMEKPPVPPSKTSEMSIKDANHLLYVAATSDDIPVMTGALQAGADINAIVFGSTALYAAVYNDRENAVRFLLDRGARFDIPNAGGVIPLDVALSPNPKPNIIRALILAGAWFSEKAENNKYFTENLEDAFKNYPLERAVLRGTIEDVQRLIAEGLDVTFALQLIENHRLNKSRLYQRMHARFKTIERMLLEGQYMQLGQQPSLFFQLLPRELRTLIIGYLVPQPTIPTR